MSKILRRPMFRGGRVDSRGSGITSGLIDRPGLQSGGTPTGAEIKAMAEKNIFGVPALRDLNRSTNFINDLGFNYGIRPLGNLANMGTNYILGTDIPMIQKTDSNKPFEDILQKEATRLSNELIPQVDEEDEYEEEYSDISEITENKKRQEKEDKKIKGQTKQVSFSNTGDGDASTVDENDLESLISRYEELLGGKKARQRDVGDMLGRASAAFLKKGARGEDRGVTDALGDFMAAESASGPSRTEKINNAAAMLGIKGEQAQKLYETKLKNVKGQFSQRVDEIMKTQGVSRSEALRLSLGKPANMGEAFINYSQKAGRPPQPVDFDALAETFTEGPLPVPFTEATGTFYIPGQMTIVKMVQGKQKGSKKYK
tara:strand:+ start:2407 stop:3522 length:1116 start_codon:yes stop_codon:yes gene_type:complete